MCATCAVLLLFGKKGQKVKWHSCTAAAHLMLWCMATQTWRFELMPMNNYSSMVTELERDFLRWLIITLWQYYNNYEFINHLQTSQWDTETIYRGNLVCTLTHRHYCTSALKPSSSGISATVLHWIRENTDSNVIVIWVQACWGAIFFMICSVVPRWQLRVVEWRRCGDKSAVGFILFSSAYI